MAEIYAYIRVSTQNQKEQRQIITMIKHDIPKKNIIIEKESGKSTERKKYKNLVNRLKNGNTLYIENIDRIGRDYDSILEQWHILKQKGVIIKVLDTPMLDTDQDNDDLQKKFLRDLILLQQAFQSESEYHKIKGRQAQGIAVAKANGKKLGRPKAHVTEFEKDIVKNYKNRDISLDTALSKLNIKKTAFYNLCKSVKNSQNENE